MKDDTINRSDVLKALKDAVVAMGGDDFCEMGVHIDDIDAVVNAIPSADRPQGEFTKREYEQFLHGISLSLLSERSAQHWRYEEETAQKIRWLEALEQKVRAQMKGADDE